MRSWRDEAGWADFVSAAAVAAFVVCLVLFVHLADDAPEGDYLVLENKIMQALRNPATGGPLGPAWVPSAVRDLTALGSAPVLIILAGLILGHLCLTRRFNAAVLLAAAIAGGQALNSGFKYLFARERPDATLHLVEVRSPSFPSGHSMAGSIFYLTTGALLAQTMRRRREKIYVIAASLLLTGLVGFSRVYLGVHYPTDVIAGWAAGTAWALLCWAWARRMRRRGQLEPAAGT